MKNFIFSVGLLVSLVLMIISVNMLLDMIQPMVWMPIFITNCGLLVFHIEMIIEERKNEN